MVLPRLLLLSLKEPFSAEQLKSAPELFKLLMDLATRKARPQMTTTTD